MNIEVISAILAVALVLVLLSAFLSTRQILWESVLHPFRKDPPGAADGTSRGGGVPEASNRTRL